MAYKGFNWNSLNPFYRSGKNGEGAAYTFGESKFGQRLQNLWNDYTGKSAIDMQNQAQLELAKYQTQMQEDFYNKYSSPEALMRQYQEAGLNPNLVYGSASAGQGNVPSFSAPQIQRNISGADKINKALSLLSGISGAATAVYQAAAAKEAAQQAVIRTASDQISFRDQVRNNLFQEDLLGMSIKLKPFKEFRKNHNYRIVYDKSGVYDRYLGEYRANQFNQWMRNGLLNQYDFGGSSDYTGNLGLMEGFVPYYSTRNKTSWLKYDLMNELGNKGVYGKLAVSLLGTLF